MKIQNLWIKARFTGVFFNQFSRNNNNSDKNWEIIVSAILWNMESWNSSPYFSAIFKFGKVKYHGFKHYFSRMEKWTTIVSNTVFSIIGKPKIMVSNIVLKNGKAKDHGFKHYFREWKNERSQYRTVFSGMERYCSMWQRRNETTLHIFHQW